MATGLTSQMAGRSAGLRVRTGPSRVFGAAVVPPRPLAHHRPAAQLQQSEPSASSSVQVRGRPACLDSERSCPDLHITLGMQLLSPVQGLPVTLL